MPNSTIQCLWWGCRIHFYWYSWVPVPVLGIVVPCRSCTSYYLQKFAGKSHDKSSSEEKIQSWKNSKVIDRDSNFLSIPVIAVFFSGELFKILTFWGLAVMRFFIWNCYLRKNAARSETGFVILSEFPTRNLIFFKNSKNSKNSEKT